MMEQKEATVGTVANNMKNLGKDKSTISPVIRISKYISHFSRDKGHYVPGCIPSDTDLYQELRNMKEGFYQDQIDTMLSLPEAEQKKFKQQHLTSITLSVATQRWRETANICARSGCIGVDIDGQDNEHVEDWGAMRDSIVRDMGSRVVFAALSARKKGVFIILKHNPKLHLGTFNFISYELKKRYNLNVDKGCKEEVRLRFVTHDPEAYINFDWENIPVIVPTDEYLSEKKEWKRSTAPAKTHKVKKANSVELFNNAVAKAEYDFKMATGVDHEFTPGNRNLILCSIAGYCNSRGMDLDFCKEQVEKKYPVNDYDVTRAVIGVYKSYKAQHGTIDINDYGDEDLQSWLETYNLRRNVITRKIEKDGQPMAQKDFNTLYLETTRAYPKLSYDRFERTIDSDFTPEYNPIKDFLEANKHRNPQGLIEKFVDCIESDTGLSGSCFYPEYKFHFFQKWFVSIIASIYGEHSYLMMVLCGNLQGTGKTEFWRRLLPKPLQTFYAESKLDAGKDDEILMCQKLLISDDEYGGKSKRDEKRIKELLSKNYFTLREPYGRHNVDLKRLAVLCGTTNDHEILSDPTGNRRIIPLNVLAIDHEKYNAIDKTDLLMEAYHLYHSGWNWHLDREDIKNLNANTADFEQTSSERDLIQKFFRVPTEEDRESAHLVEFFTATDIKTRINQSSGEKVNPTRLGMELKKMGFVRYGKKINNISVKGYDVVDVSTEGGRVDSRWTAGGVNRYSQAGRAF